MTFNTKTFILVPGSISLFFYYSYATILKSCWSLFLFTNGLIMLIFPTRTSRFLKLKGHLDKSQTFPNLGWTLRVFVSFFRNLLVIVSSWCSKFSKSLLSLILWLNVHNWALLTNSCSIRRNATQKNWWS